VVGWSEEKKNCKLCVAENNKKIDRTVRLRSGVSHVIVTQVTKYILKFKEEKLFCMPELDHLEDTENPFFNFDADTVACILDKYR